MQRTESHILIIKLLPQTYLYVDFIFFLLFHVSSLVLVAPAGPPDECFSGLCWEVTSLSRQTISCHCRRQSAGSNVVTSSQDLTMSHQPDIYNIYTLEALYMQWTSNLAKAHSVKINFPLNRTFIIDSQFNKLFHSITDLSGKFLVMSFGMVTMGQGLPCEPPASGKYLTWRTSFR